MRLTSASFSPNENIPAKYALEKVAGGENVSPSFEWQNVHENIKSFVLAIVDHHPIASNWVHWLVINIPPTINVIREGASNTEVLPENAVELINSFGNKGYGGPCPPSGSGKHNYDVALYALDIDKVNLEGQIAEERLMNEIRSHILDKTIITGYFER